MLTRDFLAQTDLLAKNWPSSFGVLSVKVPNGQAILSCSQEGIEMGFESVKEALEGNHQLDG